jgi:hypothetical protein
LCGRLYILSFCFFGKKDGGRRKNCGGEPRVRGKKCGAI